MKLLGLLTTGRVSTPGPAHNKNRDPTKSSRTAPPPVLTLRRRSETPRPERVESSRWHLVSLRRRRPPPPPPLPSPASSPAAASPVPQVSLPLPPLADPPVACTGRGGSLDRWALFVPFLDPSRQVPLASI
jgi:hypothetical protein